MNNCIGCKWHEASGVTEDGIAFGHCHRYPPVSLTAHQSVLPPINSEKGWCGEFVKIQRKAAAKR